MFYRHKKDKHLPNKYKNIKYSHDISEIYMVLYMTD